MTKLLTFSVNTPNYYIVCIFIRTSKGIYLSDKDLMTVLWVILCTTSGRALKEPKENHIEIMHTFGTLFLKQKIAVDKKTRSFLITFFYHKHSYTM